MSMVSMAYEASSSCRHKLAGPGIHPCAPLSNPCIKSQEDLWGHHIPSTWNRMYEWNGME